MLSGRAYIPRPGNKNASTFMERAGQGDEEKHRLKGQVEALIKTKLLTEQDDSGHYRSGFLDENCLPFFGIKAAEFVKKITTR